MPKYLCIYNGAKQSLYSYEVERTAGRAIDTASFEVPRTKTVNINDTIYLTISPIDLNLLTGLYQLDNTVEDTTENANTGTAYNITFVGDVHEKSAQFNGVDSLITIPNHTANIFGTSDFSLLWEMGFTSVSDMSIYDKYGNSGWNISVSGGALKLYVKDSGGVEYTYTSGTLINDNEIHHIVVTRKYGSYWKIYIDGILTDTVSNGAVLPNNIDFNNTSIINVGYSPTLGTRYTGVLDQFFFFKREIGSGEAMAYGESVDGFDHPVTIFGGYVISREYKVDRISITGESFARIIRDKFIESTKYYDKSIEYIIKDLIETGGTGLTVNGTGLIYNSTYATGINIKEYVAFGQLIDIITDLSKTVSIDFHVTYNKYFHFEPNNSIAVDWTAEAGVNISTSPWTIKDSEIINVVYVLGGSRKFNNSETFTADGVSGVFTLLYGPTATNVFMDTSGTGNSYVRLQPDIEYSVDVEAKTITIDSIPAAGYLVKVDYEYDQPIFMKTEDAPSKAQYGERARKFNADWIDNIDDARRYANGLLTFYKQPRLNGKITYPGIKCDVHEATVLHVIDAYAKPPVDQLMDVKTVRWKYPDGVTELEVGTWTPKTYEWQKDIIFRIRDLERRAAAINELRKFLQLPEIINNWLDNVTVVGNVSNQFRVASSNKVSDFYTIANPTAFYKLDTNSNDPISGFNLTQFGSPTFATSGAVYDGYISLNGTTQYLQASSNTILDVTTQDFTVFGLFYRTATGAQHRLVSKMNASSGYLVQISSTDNLSALIRNSGGTVTGTLSTTVSANTWYLFIVSFARTGNMTLHLYNISTGQYTSNTADISARTATITSVDNVTLGRSSSTSDSFLPGRLAHVGVRIGYALVQSDVDSMIKQISDILKLRLEFKGDTTDKSGNGDDFTLNGAVTYQNETAPNGRRIFGVNVLADQITDYLSKSSYSNIPTRKITLSFWTKKDNTTGTRYLFSYAIGSAFNEVLIGHDISGNLDIWMNNSEKITTVPFNLSSLNHWVIKWRSYDGSLVVYKNGISVYTTTAFATSGVIDISGIAIMGQEQDSLGGGFDPAQSWGGFIGEFQIFDLYCSDTQASNLYNYGSLVSQPIQVGRFDVAP